MEKPLILLVDDDPDHVELLLRSLERGEGAFRCVVAENLARADQAYEFPPAGSPIRLKAMLLPGQKGKTAEERIKIIATKEKEDLIPLGFQEGMFKVYDARSTGLVSDLVRRLNAIDPADWAQAQAVYTIER
ncbi:MAG: hypothetical protein A4E73_03054 [Syntrophaceae bacterium PtaU1.Bin231]|nr:MAG: hypothetical protein A4E73_03054 [Syntrophaceae bacterium PtaU1.Bin231]